MNEHSRPDDQHLSLSTRNDELDIARAHRPTLSLSASYAQRGRGTRCALSSCNAGHLGQTVAAGHTPSTRSRYVATVAVALRLAA
eukprot:5706647-Prymnesium_polylepis.1